MAEEGASSDEDAVRSVPAESLDPDQFRTVVQEFPTAVFLTDASGYLQFANRSFVETLGYDPGDEECHVAEFLPEENVDEILEVLREMVGEGVQAGTTRAVDLEAITTDGRHRQFHGTVTLLSGSGEYTGVGVALRDLTAQRRRDEVFRVINRTLRHNLRNTLTVINTASSVLDGEVAAEHQELIDSVYSSAKELETMGERLRTLQSAILESVDGGDSMAVGALVESSVEAARPADGTAEITIHVSADGQFGAHEPITYALTNVIENAIVHNDQDCPTVDIWVTHAPTDGWIDVHVEDDGPGIPPVEQQIVLGEIEPTQLQHGSGLGLWIARWVVDVLGGRIDIEDNDPRGTVVTLRFPLEET